MRYRIATRSSGRIGGGISAGGHRSHGSGTSTSGLSKGFGGFCSGSLIHRGGILITMGSRGGSSGAFGGWLGITFIVDNASVLIIGPFPS